MARTHPSHRPQPQPALGAAHRPGAHILDGLDAWGALDEAHAHATALGGYRVFGPRRVAGHTDARCAWVGVVLWAHKLGWGAHEAAWLCGVWACADATGAHQLLVGGRTLVWGAPYFNAESFHALVRRHWQPYYHHDTGAPVVAGAPGCTLGLAYDAAPRLALRADVRAALGRWLAQQAAV